MTVTAYALNRCLSHFEFCFLIFDFSMAVSVVNLGADILLFKQLLEPELSEILGLKPRASSTANQRFRIYFLRTSSGAPPIEEAK